MVESSVLTGTQPVSAPAATRSWRPVLPRTGATRSALISALDDDAPMVDCAAASKARLTSANRVVAAVQR